MAKITNPDDIDVGVELTLDTAASTFTLNVAGSLVAKDGVTLQALYSKFVDLWTTATYNKFEFPMYTIDAKSGQYQFGTDGATFSGWKPANDATRQMLRDGGWSEYSSAGVLQRQYVGIVSLGDVNTGAQLYYQKTNGGAAADFTFDDEVNEGIQVYGDASNGNFDSRTYFKGYVREYAKKYDDSVLADTGQTATGAYTVNLLLANEDDLKIQDTDVNVAADAPYTGITATWIVGNNFDTTNTSPYSVDDVVKDGAGRWYICTGAGTADATDFSNLGTMAGAGTATFSPYSGEREIGGVYYAFNIIIDGNAAVAEDIYTKIQYLLRQNSDIDSGSGTQTVSAIQVLNADGSPIAVDGNHLWLQCTGDGYTSDGGEVLLPGWDLTAVSTGIGASVPNNTLPEVDAAEGCEVYVSIGTWSGGAFLPANMGNVNIAHCPGAYTVTRDQA